MKKCCKPNLAFSARPENLPEWLQKSIPLKQKTILFVGPKPIRVDPKIFGSIRRHADVMQKCKTAFGKCITSPTGHFGPIRKCTLVVPKAFPSTQKTQIVSWSEPDSGRSEQNQAHRGPKRDVTHTMAKNNRKESHHPIMRSSRKLAST